MWTKLDKCPRRVPGRDWIPVFGGRRRRVRPVHCHGPRGVDQALPQAKSKSPLAKKVISL